MTRIILVNCRERLFQRSRISIGLRSLEELPDISARISETIAAMVTPTVAPTRAEARERLRAHFTMVIFVAQQTPEMIARRDAVSIIYFADSSTRLYVAW